MSNSTWITAIVCLLAGVIIGLIIGRIMAAKKGTSASSVQRSRQTGELQQLHQDIDIHFAHMTKLADELQNHSRALSSELSEYAEKLSQDTSTKRRLAVLSGARSAEEVAEEEAAEMTVPRDYADGSGTLAEGFGIRNPNHTEESEVQQPPRY